MFLLNKLKSFARNYSSNIKPFSEIPSPKGLPIVGSLFSLIATGGASHLHDYIDRRHEQLGAIFQDKLGPITSVFLNDPKDIRMVFANEGKYPKHVLPECWLLYNEVKNSKRGLYFMDGEEWYNCRKLLNDLLLKQNFFEEISQNSAYVADFLQTLLQNSKGGEVSNLEIQLYNLSLILTMSIIFGSAFREQANLFQSNIQKLAPLLKNIYECSVKLSLLPASLALRLNLRPWKEFVKAIDQSVEITTTLINDALQYRHDGVFHLLLKKNVPMCMIRRLIIDLIFAGGDTTAFSAMWLLYLLGRHSIIQDQLYIDITNNRYFWQSVLLKNVVKESMRLYPIAPFIARYLPNETEIASYRIPSNTLISMSIFNCGRNEKYFPDKNQFIPDRWNRLSNGKYVGVVDPYASLPYAMGARSCIGRNISKAQLYVIINEMISLFKLDVRNEVDVKLNLITVPSQPIELYLTKR